MNAAGSGGRRVSALVVLASASLVALALGVRLAGLDSHTLTHAEVYVPRLAMPDYVSAPPPRTTLAQTLLGTLHHDNHPPGYYAGMWLWTGLAGTGLFALRLPSALAGAATVALLFCAVRRRDGAWIALTAAALLALHGHHVFWSQQARMWVFLACCAVASVVLLQSLERRHRPGTAALYVFVLAAGLWLDYSFWPFVAAQIAWVALRRCRAPRLPASIEYALLALVLSAPALAFLHTHLGLGRTAYLAQAGVVDHLTGFFLMQWLVRSPPGDAPFGPLESVAVLALLVTGILLLVAGVVRAREDTAEVAAPPGPDPVPGLVRFAAALVPTLFGGWLIARGERGAFAVAAVALPWGLLALAVAAGRSWPVCSRALRAMRSRDWVRRVSDDPATLHTFLPLLMLLGISLLVPSVAARSLLFVTPFALWLAARGLAALLAHPLARGFGTALLLAAGCVSVWQYTRHDLGGYDYRALANAMQPFLRPGDAVLINDAWWTQPMHYYLPPDRYRTGPFGSERIEAAGDRIWFVLLDPKDAAAFEITAAQLRGFARGRRLRAAGAQAVLLERAPGEAANGRRLH